MLNRINSFKLFLFLFFLLFAKTTFGQIVQPDTLFVSNAIRQAKKIYTSYIASDAHLFNGIQYRELNLHNYDQGFPYFLSDDWSDGSIFYDGQLYEGISMLYDITHDKIIIDHPYSHFSIELINEKTKSFSISNHNFIRLVKDSLGTSPIRTGFYELLYDGKVKLYAKRKKEIHEVLEGRIVTLTFENRDQFFVYKNRNYFSVRSKASVLKVFNDRKSSLRKFYHKSNISFHANRDAALVESARFYDESEK